jgi:hypothetical protein
MRVEQMNLDPSSPFQVAESIAFGIRVVAQEAGSRCTIGYGAQTAGSSIGRSPAKSSMLYRHLIEDWMRKRSYRDLLRAR